MLINNGYRTIVIAGGDSALNDAVNCLMKVEKQQRDTISLGVIPNGVMNDFARFWGYDEDNIEQTVDWLVKGRTRQVDLGCIRYTNNKQERCHRYFLNCLNIGMTADIMNLRRQTRRLFGSRTLSFITSLFVMLFHRMEYKMKLRINSDTIERKVMTVCIGSGPGYGQTPNAVPYNGMLDVSVVYHPDVGSSSWLRQRSSVDLPVPDGPITEMTSPLFISAQTSLSGVTFGYSFLKCSIFIMLILMCLFSCFSCQRLSERISASTRLSKQA
jgi:Sphingosine kinase and enzymes related to eukaryotic diacylglycerol kinase